VLTVIVFVVALGLLIFVHELGHFLVARKNGIRAEEFGFGFPPRIFGIQFISGEKLENISCQEEVRVKVEEYQLNKKTEVIKETFIKKVKEVGKSVPVGKWRFIWGKWEDDSRQEKKDLKEINKEKYKTGTIFSLNWIPLGGFVRIKGEDGSAKKEPDSFASKSAWKRIKVLAAGVIMNFALAWLLITLAFIIGAPQPIESESANVKNSKIQIAEVISGTPAEAMGIKAGDEIISCQIPSLLAGENNLYCQTNFSEISQVQALINDYKGKEIILEIKRGSDVLRLKGVPRISYPENQGSLGISMVKTAIVNYPWYQAIWKGLTTTFDLIITIIVTLFNILKSLIMGQKATIDVTGPVGIATLTKQVTALGFVYILQFVALLSINLGIINGLPIPALDGGRILFILIEKIKGSPVSQKFEQLSHSIGFALLIALMVFITFRDIVKLDVLDRIRSLF
jgi:regulator of sigma E protease